MESSVRRNVFFIPYTVKRGNPILYFFYSLVRMTVTQYATTLQNGLLKIQENEENEIKYISFIRVGTVIFYIMLLCLAYLHWVNLSLK